MNSHFYKVWLPLQIATFTAFVLLAIGYSQANWIYVFLTWFLIGPIGMGVGYHRLFSHRQFQTWRPVEYVLALLGTLACYAPVLFWASQHQFHHSVTDEDHDPSSPTKHGFWESFLWWRLRQGVIKKINLRHHCTRIILRDKMLMFMSNRFELIILTYVIFLSIFGIDSLINFFIIPAFIEHFRINVVSSLSHIKVPFSYQNFNTNDHSYNNPILGWLTMGFAWHNNHHHNARELVNMHRWWELDIEGLLAKAISKK